MEYFRDPKNQIYAHIAFRLGKIVTQYEKVVIEEEKFEATLYLTVLQNLLTNSNEYVRQMTRSDRKNSIFSKDISDSIWGIDDECWIENTFIEKHTLQNFIIRIRNSISHPTETDVKSEFPSTGYTTIKDNSGIIKKFIFINSPDTRENRVKQYKYEAAEKLLNGEMKHEFPDSVAIEEIPNITDKKYQIINNGKPFARISKIVLTVNQLSSFVKELANSLAQPIRKDYDGVTHKDLIAA
jgi:hypothetical protein